MIKELSGWSGEVEITVLPSEEKHIIKNRITDAALNILRNALYGDAVSAQINYIAVGDGTTAISDSHTQLVSETFRTPVTTRTKTSTGILDIVGILLDTDGALTIREIGFFAGGTGSANSGTMISRVLWTRDKTNLESIQIARTDTIKRG